MVCKNRGIYEFLCTSWVLITMAPRNTKYASHADSRTHSAIMASAASVRSECVSRFKACTDRIDQIPISTI